MQLSTDVEQHVSHWLAQCVALHPLHLQRIVPIKQQAGREVWACTLQTATGPPQLILTVYTPSPPTMVNTSLSATETAQKCAWAMIELAAMGLPVPQVVGMAVHGDAAAVVTAKIDRKEWQPQTRVLAAQWLARLHSLPPDSLSAPLQQLIVASDPKPERTYRWFVNCVEQADKATPGWRKAHGPLAAAVQELMDTGLPPSQPQTLVHGDYFSANILATSTDICVLDWETLALGDPMWDLAFLVGADGPLEPQVSAASVAAYAALAPLAQRRLQRYSQVWAVGWSLLRLAKPARHHPILHQA